MNLLTWLDDAIELSAILEKLVRDGFTFGVFLSVAVFFIRRYRKRFPSQLDRIERKVDILGERQGIQWDAHGLKPYGKVSAMKSKSLSISRLGAFTTVRIAGRFIEFITQRGINMGNKFKSRKFWMAVVTAILIVLNDGLGLGVSAETVLAFAGLVATWILGESAVDMKRAGNGGKGSDNDLEIPTDTRV